MYKNFICVTNRNLCKGDFLNQIEKIVSLKVHSIILREKDLNEEEYKALALKVLKLTKGTPLYLHTNLTLAKELKVEGIHLSYASFMKMFQEGEDFASLKVSVSCHSLEEVMNLSNKNVDHIILGTIFETDCKPGKKGSGLDFLEEACKITSTPIYAIGGIKLHHHAPLLERGAKGGAIMSLFMTL